VDLKPAGREYYTLEFTATDIGGLPIVDPGIYEVSFDGGLTWFAGEEDQSAGVWQWLVAGAIAEVGDAVTVLSGASWIVPEARLVDNPEIVVRDMPPIYLTG
jgi:hypothetical protein